MLCLKLTVRFLDMYSYRIPGSVLLLPKCANENIHESFIYFSIANIFPYSYEKHTIHNFLT